MRWNTGYQVHDHADGGECAGAAPGVNGVHDEFLALALLHAAVEGAKAAGTSKVFIFKIALHPLRVLVEKLSPLFIKLSFSFDKAGRLSFLYIMTYTYRVH